MLRFRKPAEFCEIPSRHVIQWNTWPICNPLVFHYQHHRSVLFYERSQISNRRELGAPYLYGKHSCAFSKASVVLCSKISISVSQSSCNICSGLYNWLRMSSCSENLGWRLRTVEKLCHGTASPAQHTCGPHLRNSKYTDLLKQTSNKQ